MPGLFGLETSSDYSRLFLVFCGVRLCVDLLRILAHSKANGNPLIALHLTSLTVASAETGFDAAL